MLQKSCYHNPTSYVVQENKLCQFMKVLRKSIAFAIHACLLCFTYKMVACTNIKYIYVSWTLFFALNYISVAGKVLGGTLLEKVISKNYGQSHCCQISI